jgi:hypothetical protein
MTLGKEFFLKIICRVPRNLALGKGKFFFENSLPSAQKPGTRQRIFFGNSLPSAQKPGTWQRIFF